MPNFREWFSQGFDSPARNNLLTLNVFDMRKLFIIACALFCMNTIQAQGVVQNGNTFTMVSKPKETKTNYTYVVNGVSYPVYLSSKGKAYIKRISKKTGKEYKMYVPEIGKKINPKAYM